MQLTNRKVVVSNKKQSFAERLYLPAIAKGMVITASHLFKRPPTIMYPEQKRPPYRHRYAGPGIGSETSG